MMLNYSPQETMTKTINNLFISCYHLLSLTPDRYTERPSRTPKAEQFCTVRAKLGKKLRMQHKSALLKHSFFLTTVFETVFCSLSKSRWAFG